MKIKIYFNDIAPYQMVEDLGGEVLGKYESDYFGCDVPLGYLLVKTNGIDIQVYKRRLHHHNIEDFIEKYYGGE